MRVSAHKKGRSKAGKIVRGLFLAAGLFACFLPLFLQSAWQKNSTSQLDGALQDARKSEQPALDAALASAQAWNARLYSAGSENSAVSAQSYEQQLTWMEEGMMGVLKIAAIDLELPILHDSSEESLRAGAGHLDWSSLPCGGENTHCVLSSHRGMAYAQLFTRLDEVEKGDLILIENPKETLAYEVDGIETVLPSQSESLQITPGEDRLSLVTCTPYGLNTHRLLVHASRKAYTHEQIEEQLAEVSHSIRPNGRSMLFLLTPFVLLVLVLAVFACRVVRVYKGRREEKRRRYL